MANFISDKRYFLTADGSRAVDEGDPAAATLLVGKGGELPQAEAERYGLKLDEAKPPTPLDAERAGLDAAMERGAFEEARIRREHVAALEAQDEQEKARRKPADKARHPESDKGA